MKLLQDADKYTQAHRQKKWWYRVVTCLAAVVVFCTTYALILPAITLEGETCALQEHTHSVECYRQVTTVSVKEPVCTLESLALHKHNEACYDDNGLLTCGYADFMVHTHDVNCYTEDGALWCPLPEIKAHIHEADCYWVPQVHAHTAVCYTLEQGALICTESTEDGHIHGEACYSTTKELACENPEREGHTHATGCYNENGDLACEQEETAGHTHDESCYITSTVLICGRQEEIGHQHTEECYEWHEVLTCGQEEGEVENGIPSEPVLICEEPEVILHTHQPYESPEDPGCYDEDGNLVCGQIQVLEHQHTEDCFTTVEEPLDTDALTCTLPEDETHTHGPLCYGTWELICELQEHTHSEECTPLEPVYFCGLEEHTHGETCYNEDGELICGLEEHIHEEACLTEPTEEEAQDEVQLILPAGARIPEGYDAQYSCMDSDNRFGVVVYAPEGVLPEGAVLSAELLSPDSAAYANAEQALADTKYDGFAAMDIRFLLDGEEVEPEGGVYVCINVMGLLSEDADETSLAVQHHRQSGIALLALDEEEAPTGITVETVADAAQETGQVEAVNSGTGNTLDIAAAFEVECFSTFTVTWQDSYKLILHYVDTDRNSILEGESETALATYSELESVTLSQYANRISHSGYAYDSAYVLLNGVKTTVVQVKYDKNQNIWQYTVDGNNWLEWMDETNHTADVYLSYTRVTGNDIVPPENNVYPVDAINVWDENANVILVYPRHFTDKDILENNIVINLYDCFPSAFSSPDTSKSEWTVYRIENRKGRYQVLQNGTAKGAVGVQVNDAYLLLVKNDYIRRLDLYSPKEEWIDSNDRDSDWGGDTVQINLVLQHTNTEETTSTGTPLAYLTFSPKENNANADTRADDVAAVANSAIKFQLFNYSTKINRPNGGNDGWRAITPYFQFRGQQDSRMDLSEAGNTDRDNRYDEDGFTVNHATVERTLTNNYPVLDPNRNALGLAKSPAVSEADLPSTERSLDYLFGGKTDGAVTAYNPTNTILQKSGTHYYYNSAYNAVDYDIANRVFRVRNYVERNSSTASYGDAQKYYDFLPFNYTDGQVVGTSGSDARTYNLASSDVDYWFGMRMDVDFYQSKDGILNGEQMVFHFSGDDDVWVFIDDVLVLDLGGTHGTVTGYINFATGVIKQYLDWNGDVGTEGVTSFTTSIKACYEAAGKDPNGGWNGDIFADYTKHKLSFFYMERGCAVANCAIDFNLPTLPEKSLQVAKTLTADADADADVVKHLENTMEYKFRVVKADANGKPTDELLIQTGDTYTLSGTGISGSQTCTVGPDGYFTLKSGQIAEFTNMLSRFSENESPKQYFVQEVLPSSLTGQYDDVIYTVGSGTNTCKEETTQIGTDFTGFNSPILDSDVGNLVSYKNVVDTEQLSTLEITKNQVGSSLNGEPECYYMKVQLGPDSGSLMPISVGTTYYVGNETRNVETAGIIQLKAGETAKVKLLAGTYYKVEEVADGSGTTLTGREGYTPTYSNASGTVTEVGTTVNITVTNTFPNGALELTKIVNNTAGGSTDGEFTFELKFPVEGGWKDTAYTATYETTDNGQTHTGNTLSFAKQGDYAVAAVNLYHNETVTITGLPANAVVEITETNADGYSIGWKVNGQDVYVKPVTCPVVDGTKATVICTNTTGYELPNTGGAGTNLYTVGGLLLMAGAAFLLLYIHTKRRKGDVTSS